MPILAHLDDPPRPRTRGMLVGFAVAVPVAAVFVLWVIPTLIHTVLSGASDLDSRLRAEEQYMQALCAASTDPARDERLCGCVLATEFPALDCQPAFRHWTLLRQVEACADPGARSGATSFCACVDVIADKAGSAAQAERDREVAAYENCTALPDALYLPTIDAL